MNHPVAPAFQLSRISYDEALDLVRSWVDAARPLPGEPAASRIAVAVSRLEADPALRARFGGALRTLFEGAQLVDTLTTEGILDEAPLHQELGHRAFRRLLPPVSDPSTLDGLLGELFHAPGDPEWLAAVPSGIWQRLQDALSLRVDPSVPIPADLALALRILAHRIAALGLRPALTSRVPELGLGDSPFLALSDQVLAYVRSHGNGETGDEAPLLETCTDTLGRVREAVHQLRANKHRYGTSLELTALSFRMLGLVDRLEVLLELTDPRERPCGRDAGRLLVDLVRARAQRNDLVPLLRQHADLLAYEVVEHAAKKGRHYITTTWSEYGRFLLSSLGGGLIVAFFALGKVELGALPLSDAGQALVYGLNYAVAFALIYLSGATLATKQPAVTAHTLAATLDGPEPGDRLGRLVEMITRAARSQFISFVGNLAMAFPLGLLLAHGWTSWTGVPLADPETATKLLAEVHPWQGAALWYAAIAGVFLFGAGVVAGWVDNRFVYNKVPERVAAHPHAVRFLGRRGAGRLARFADEKAGALAGNVFLGFALGAAGTLGHIVGLPFDIRHVAFASAHLAVGLEGLAWDVGATQLLVLGLGVALIGFVNFVVSFGLALLLAIESRGLGLGEGRELLRLLRQRLYARPWDFFFPPLARDPGPGTLPPGPCAE